MMLFAYFEVHVLLHIFAFETWSFKGAITVPLMYMYMYYEIIYEIHVGLY